MGIFDELKMTDEMAKDAELAFKLTVAIGPEIIKLNRSGFCAMMATLMDIWCDEHDEEPLDMYLRLASAKIRLNSVLNEILGSDSDD